MKRILLLLCLLPALAGAQTAKDTVNVLSDSEISAGTVADTVKVYYIQGGSWKKSRMDSIAKYTRVKLVGDKGDITVSGSFGETWSIDAGAVTWDDLAQAVKDSIGAGGGGGGGGVTSISAGNGITVSPSPITTTGTVSADTSVLATKTATNNALALKLNAADTTSLSNRINLKLNISDTLDMLLTYINAADTAAMLSTYAKVGSGGIADGDKGDIDVTSSGAVWTVDTNAVTTVKINDGAVTGAKTNFAGVSGDATRLLGATSTGTTDTVQVGAGLTISGGVLRSKSDTLAMIIAVSDETTAIDTGAAKVTFRSPFAMRIVGVRANVNTASTSGLPTIDINDTNVSIFSTLLTIDANEKTSVTATTAAVIDSAKRDIGDDDEMTIDIDTAGTGAKGLKVTIYYVRQ